MAEKKTADEGRATDQVSEQDLQASFVGPAFHVNRAIASSVSAGVRIAFLEDRGQAVKPIFRTAVLLSISDADGLRQILERHLKRIGDVVAKAQAKEASPES